jgi:mycofactocin system creatininase family protein
MTDAGDPQDARDAGDLHRSPRNATRLADLTWPQVRGELLVVPIGSLEQHGPHLPLSTDTDIALALAEQFVQGDPQATLAPTISYGASGEHADFPGTVSIGQSALEHLLVELGRSASSTFDRIVFVSTHGGNAAPVARATRQLISEGRSVIAWSPRWDGDAHAGRVETSIMLALDPARVDRSRAAAGNVTPLPELMPELVGNGVRAVSPNGVLGDPLTSSVEEGRRLLALAGADLRSKVSES